MRTDSPYAALNRVFHEPNRMAIMSALCSSAGGVSFADLRQSCGLTDGNLNRHLKTLEEEGAVRMRKSFRGARPLTTVELTELGRQKFVRYLRNLEQVLILAADSVVEDDAAVSLSGMLGRAFGGRAVEAE